jgi:hypothetical protein
MSSDPGDFTGRSQNRGRRPPAGSQGASRGGVPPDGPGDDADRQPSGNAGSYERGYTGSSGSGGSGGAPFGGFPFGGSGKSGRSGATFLGLPVNLIYAIGGAIILIVVVGAMCGKPTATGSVAGQVKALGADRTVSTLAGAQIVLRGSNQTYTATSTDVPADAEGEAAYNYRLENVPPGNYTMAVTPPAGSTLQPEQDISFKVESGQLFPQSVMLLAQGIQKPRALAQNELQPGETGGYINDRGERIVAHQGGGFDASDALLMYLLWRNPPGWGYGYPPIIVNSPGGNNTSGYNYRVSDPPTQSRSGQTVTQRKPETPGQGSTRPSSSTGATGSGPSYSSGTGSSGTGSSTSGAGSGSSSSGSGSGSTTQTKPSTSSGSGSSVSAPSVPSQGASRPSSSSSSPSRSSAPSRSSGSSSGGGRR